MAGIDALPVSDYQLQAGQNYTLVIKLTGGYTAPSNTALSAEVRKVMGKLGVADVLSVTSTFGASTYNIALRMRKTVPYSTVINTLKLWIHRDMGRQVEEIDLIGGVAQAQSILTSITAPVSSATEAVTGLTSSLKWIVLGGAAIVGFVYLGPILKRFGGRR